MDNSCASHYAYKQRFKMFCLWNNGMLIGTLRTALDMKEENLPKNEFLKRQKRIKGQNRLRNFYNYFCNEKNFSNYAISHKKEE